MRKLIALFLFLFLCGAAFGQLSQFRMIGSGSWTTVNDSTFSSTVTIQSDLTSNGFLPTGITDSMKIFSQTGQRYRISSATNLTFSGADLIVVESGGDWGVPVGQILIYENQGREAVPSIPFSATGSTAKMQEAAVTYNSSLTGDVIDGDKGDILINGGDWVIDNNAIDQSKILDGEVTPSEIQSTTVIPGSYINLNATIDEDGRITSASGLGIYWNGLTYEDTAWVASLPVGKQDIVRAGLLDQSEIPDLIHYIPSPDTTFTQLLDRWDWKIGITEDNSGVKIAHNIDVEKTFATREDWETEYYVDVNTGSDANDGLTLATPWKTLKKALEHTTAKYINVLPGMYGYLNSFNAGVPTADKVFKRYGGAQGDLNVMSCIDNRPFTLHSGNVYTGTFNLVTFIHDTTAPKAANNTLDFLTEVNSIVECEALAGSYYYSAPDIYVHTFDSRAPVTGEILAGVSAWDYAAVQIPSPNAITIYIEGFDFYGLGRSKIEHEDAVMVIKDCRKVHGIATASSGFTAGQITADDGTIIFDGCESYDNDGDGFAYSNITGGNLRAIELDCAGYSNFNSASSAVDGSSIHHQASIIRIGGGKTLSGARGGEYYDNGNNGIHDTASGTGALSWNIGINCYNQRNLNINGVDFYMGGGSTAALQTWNTLCFAPLSSTSSVQWKDEGGASSELRWCYPKATTTPSLGTTEGTLDIVK